MTALLTFEKIYGIMIDVESSTFMVNYIKFGKEERNV